MDLLNIPQGQELNVLSARIPEWNGWLATYVVDEAGNSIGASGTSKSIGNFLDLQLLIALRSKADAIVTTGATARAEQYKATRLAPILFLTKHANSLAEIPAFRKPGSNENLLLGTADDSELFISAQSLLATKGYAAFLYEGGTKTLGLMLGQLREFRLVLDVANLADPAELDPLLILHRLLPGSYDAKIEDDFATDENRVTTWLISA